LIKPFSNARGVRIIVAGAGIQTTWFATDFRFGTGVLIDDWK
jgi:hypothetical protein